jgi:curved DNA-binding protein CbpA
MDVQQLRQLVSTLELRLRSESLYAVLGVPANADEAAIRDAYRKFARQLHADSWAGQDLGDLGRRMQAVMGELTKAQSRLINPAERAEYDAMLTLNAQGVPTDIRAIFDAEEAFKNGKKALERNGMQDALGSFRRAYDLNPSEPDHQAYLRWLEYVVAEQPNAAFLKRTVDVLTKLANDNPKRDSICVLLGHVYRTSNDSTNALKWYREASQRNPENLEARTGLRLLRARNDKEKEGNFLTRLFKR